VFDWLNANLHGLFVAISHFVETVLGAIEAPCCCRRPGH
jgi:hypothetical protein